MSLADLEKWDAKYNHPADVPTEPSATLVQLADWLPREGNGLDVAGGAGRNAIWFARRGLSMTVADVSPAGLRLAKQRAEEAGASLETKCCDLDNEANFPPGPWDLIVVVCYQCRHLLAAMHRELASGGTLAVVQPTIRNLERHSRPSVQYLFEERELFRLTEPLFDIVHYQEDWSADGRHDAVLVARKP